MVCQRRTCQRGRFSLTQPPTGVVLLLLLDGRGVLDGIIVVIHLPSAVEVVNWQSEEKVAQMREAENVRESKDYHCGHTVDGGQVVLQRVGRVGRGCDDKVQLQILIIVLRNLREEQRESDDADSSE